MLGGGLLAGGLMGGMIADGQNDAYEEVRFFSLFLSYFYS
jgi:hypothetical protein